MTRAETIARLQDANKKLRAQNRQLRKELKKLTQDMELLQSIWQAEVHEVREFRREKRRLAEEAKLPDCPQCGNNTLERKEAGAWLLESCTACSHFERSRNDED